jgi:hypothetical protein
MDSNNYHHQPRYQPSVQNYPPTTEVNSANHQLHPPTQYAFLSENPGSSRRPNGRDPNDKRNRGKRTRGPKLSRSTPNGPSAISGVQLRPTAQSNLANVQSGEGGAVQATSTTFAPQLPTQAPVSPSDRIIRRHHLSPPDTQMPLAALPPPEYIFQHGGGHISRNSTNGYVIPPPPKVFQPPVQYEESRRETIPEMLYPRVDRRQISGGLHSSNPAYDSFHRQEHMHPRASNNIVLGIEKVVIDLTDAASETSEPFDDAFANTRPEQTSEPEVHSAVTNSGTRLQSHHGADTSPIVTNTNPRPQQSKDHQTLSGKAIAAPVQQVSVHQNLPPANSDTTPQLRRRVHWTPPDNANISPQQTPDGANTTRGVQKAHRDVIVTDAVTGTIDTNESDSTKYKNQFPDVSPSSAALVYQPTRIHDTAHIRDPQPPVTSKAQLPDPSQVLGENEAVAAMEPQDNLPPGERKRLAKVRQFDSSRFDSLVYYYNDATPPEGLVIDLETVNRERKKASKQEKLFLPVDPRIHGRHNKSEAWFEKKQEEIKRRGGRKFWFGRAARRMRWLREKQMAEERIRQEAIQRGEVPPPKEPQPWSYRRCIDFGDVPEEELPQKVKDNAAWLAACAWLREDRKRYLAEEAILQKEFDRLEAEKMAAASAAAADANDDYEDDDNFEGEGDEEDSHNDKRQRVEETKKREDEAKLRQAELRAAKEQEARELWEVIRDGPMI